jgi:hypothetical protein
MGAHHVFDYNSPTCISDIRKVTNDQLGFAFDTVSTQDTANFCSEAIGSKGGKYTSLSPIPNLPRNDVSKIAAKMAFTAIGEDFVIGGTEIPAVSEDFAFAVKFMRLVEHLLSQHRIKVHPPSLRSGGLSGVLDGLQEMRDGKVSGVKLVYSMN